jgi:hypothetical protein
MTNEILDPTVEIATAEAEPYASAAAMRAAHVELLERRRIGALTDDILDAAATFLRRGQATGALLDTDEDRWASQSLLDYWANALYRAGRETPDATLADFDPSLHRSYRTISAPTWAWTRSAKRTTPSSLAART